jgi:hypothetical protein
MVLALLIFFSMRRLSPSGSPRDFLALFFLAVFVVPFVDTCLVDALELEWRGLVRGPLFFAAAAARFARRAAILAGLDRDLPLEAVLAGRGELLAAVVVLNGCL